MNGARRYPVLILMVAHLMGQVLLPGQDLHCLVPIFKWVQVINIIFNLLLDQSLRPSQQVGLLPGDRWPSLLNRQRRAQRHRPGYESFIYSTLFCNRFVLKIDQSRLSCSFLPAAIYWLDCLTAQGRLSIRYLTHREIRGQRRKYVKP